MRNYTLLDNMMTELFLILVMASLWAGCGRDSPTGEEEKELSVWTITYDDGNIKEEYQYYHHPDNNSRIRDGWYNSYYYNGEYKEIGIYKNDEKDGKWSKYDEMGTIIDEDIYREGSCVESCEWRKTFGEGWGNSVQQTVDGGFIVTGEYFDSSFYIFLLKTDSSGNEQWRKIFGKGWGRSVQQTVDGGFIVAGHSGDATVFLLKTDGQGNEQWRKTYGIGRSYSVQQTVDGGFVVTGMDGVITGSYDVFLLKTDSSGNEQWRKTYGAGRSYSVQQTADRGFVVTGRDGIITGSYDMFLLKTDGSGNEQWRKIFGEGWGRSVQQTVDEGFIVTGILGDSDRSSILLFKTNRLGYIDDLVDE